MDNKYIGAIICAVVVVILTGSLLMPIINDAVDDTKVYYNNIKGGFANVSEGEEIDITASFTIGERGSGVMEINGVSQTILAGSPRIVIIGDKLNISQTSINGFSLYGISTESMVTVDLIKNLTAHIVNNQIALTVTVSDDTVTSYNFECDWLYYRYNGGDYRVLDYLDSEPTTVYINSIDQVYGSNRLHTTNQYFSFIGDDVKIYDVDSITTTKANVTLTEVMNGVYSIVVDPDRSTDSAFSFEVDNQGNPYIAYPYYYVVPVEVYGQTESNIAYTGLLLTIPVLVLIGALVGIIGVSIRARY